MPPLAHVCSGSTRVLRFLPGNIWKFFCQFGDSAFQVSLLQRVFSNSARELPLDASESFGGYSVILGKKHRLTPPGISLRYGVGISIILGDSAFKYRYNRGYSAIPLGNYRLTPLRALEGIQ